MAWGHKRLRVPFARTPSSIARRMLSLAGVTKEDVVLDIGSGSGSIILEAAKSFGSKAIGIEIDPDLAAISVRKAESEGVRELVTVLRGDFYSMSLPKASVVTLYLLPSSNAFLARKILERMPDARVVAHQFPIPGWRPIEIEEYAGTKLFLYVPRKSSSPSKA